MSKPKNEDEVRKHKQQALDKFEVYMEKLISSNNSKDIGKADKLSYWLEDWSTFLDFESSFNPMSLRRYKRGEIIKVHLGFNIGSEEGGLHYAIVLDKNNPKSSPVITIIPLTSVKPSTDTTNLKSGCVFLGNEIFTNLNAKMSSIKKRTQEELDLLTNLMNSMDDNTPLTERMKASDRIDSLNTDILLFSRMRKEVLKMRVGSIALVNQITTISKIRIYDPKTDHDILSGIRLSNEKLDLIDMELRKRFINM